MTSNPHGSWCPQRVWDSETPTNWRISPTKQIPGLDITAYKFTGFYMVLPVLFNWKNKQGTSRRVGHEMPMKIRLLACISMDSRQPTLLWKSHHFYSTCRIVSFQEAHGFPALWMDLRMRVWGVPTMTCQTANGECRKKTAPLRKPMIWLANLISWSHW